MTAQLQKLTRHFIPTDFFLYTWQDIEPYFTTLQNATIDSLEQLEQWLMQARVGKILHILLYRYTTAYCSRSRCIE